MDGKKNGGGDGVVGDVATCVEKILNPLFGNHDGLVSFDFKTLVDLYLCNHCALPEAACVWLQKQCFISSCFELNKK
jgi:hypothetical protein